MASFPKMAFGPSEEDGEVFARARPSHPFAYGAARTPPLADPILGHGGGIYPRRVAVVVSPSLPCPILSSAPFVQIRSSRVAPAVAAASSGECSYLRLVLTRRRALPACKASPWPRGRIADPANGAAPMLSTRCLREVGDRPHSRGPTPSPIPSPHQRPLLHRLRQTSLTHPWTLSLPPCRILLPQLACSHSEPPWISCLTSIPAPCRGHLSLVCASPFPKQPHTQTPCRVATKTSQLTEMRPDWKPPSDPPVRSEANPNSWARKRRRICGTRLGSPALVSIDPSAALPLGLLSLLP